MAMIRIETTTGAIEIDPAECDSVILSTGGGQRTVAGAAVRKMFQDWCAADQDSQAKKRQNETIARGGEEFLRQRGRRDG